MLGVIALGFGKSFFLRPWFSDTPLPTYLVVHGLVLTAWYLLFLVQAIFVSTGRSYLHRKLGIVGVLLAAGVVITSAVVHLNVIPRREALGHITNAAELSRNVDFVLGGLSSLIPFVVLIGFAVVLRRDAAVHKRLMYWALVWTLGPAFTDNRPLGQVLDSLVVPYLPFFPADLFWFAALMAYDWKEARRIDVMTYLGFFSLAFYFFFVTEWIVGVESLQEWLRAYVRASG